MSFTSVLAQNAVVNNALAYAQRGPWIQYDQLSMDRMAQVTTRHHIYAEPEEATEQKTLFLDCSSFYWTLFHSTFGYEMEAKLTWEMIDLVKPRILYHELTHEESQVELEQIAANIRDLLQPGDGIVYQRSDNGHIMMYMGQGRIIHCTPGEACGSYDYELCREQRASTGAIRMGELKYLLAPCDDQNGLGRNYLFGEGIRRFAIIRPLDCCEKLQANAAARMEMCRDLRCRVETSHPGGTMAGTGEKIVYSLTVENTGIEKRTLNISFDGSAERAVIASGKKVRREFEVIARLAKNLVQPRPEIVVNGMHLTAPRVLAGSLPTNAQLTAFLAETRDEHSAGSALRKQGVLLPNTVSRCMQTLFFRYDGKTGDVLVRKPQQPKKDLCVPGLFGGKGVITPERAWNHDIRTAEIALRDLMPGDLVLCTDDARFTKTYTCVFTGTALKGRFSYGGAIDMISGPAADRFMESLFGRFGFAVLRPWMGQ